jgi:hypothetical protein
MRISVSSWAATEADVDRSLQAMVRLARADQSCNIVRRSMPPWLIPISRIFYATGLILIGIQHFIFP